MNLEEMVSLTYLLTLVPIATTVILALVSRILTMQKRDLWRAFLLFVLPVGILVMPAFISIILEKLFRQSHIILPDWIVWAFIIAAAVSGFPIAYLIYRDSWQKCALLWLSGLLTLFCITVLFIFVYDNLLPLGLMRCSEEKPGWSRDVCMDNVADRMNNSKYCKYINDTATLANCVGKNSQKGFLGKCKLHDDAKFQDTCYSAHAEEHNFIDACLKITDIEMRDECLYELSYRTADYQHCNNISNTTGRRPEDCFHRVGTETSLIANCDSIVNVYVRDSCYITMFYRAHELSYCSMIEDMSLRIRCYSDAAYYAGNISLCLNTDSMITCAARVARRQQDSSICRYLEKNGEYDCISEMDIVNPEICSRVKEKYLKNKCLLTAAMQTRNYSWCHLMTMDYGANMDSACLFYFAVISHNETLCEMVPDQNFSDMCKMSVRKTNADLSVCDKWSSDKFFYNDCMFANGLVANKIQDIENYYDGSNVQISVVVNWPMLAACNKVFYSEYWYKEACAVFHYFRNAEFDTCNNSLCYYGYALRTRDMGACMHLADNVSVNFQSKCMAEIAMENADFNQCSRVPNDYWRAACYREIGIRTKNSTACDMVTEEYQRRLCFCEVSGLLGDDSLCTDGRCGNCSQLYKGEN